MCIDDSGSVLRWLQGKELCDHRTGTTYTGNAVGRRMHGYPLGGVKQSNSRPGTLGIVIRCILMVAMMLSHLDVKNQISIS